MGREAGKKKIWDLMHGLNGATTYAWVSRMELFFFFSFFLLGGRVGWGDGHIHLELGGNHY